MTWSNGRFFNVGNPIGNGRMPLVLSLSRDGVSFDQHCVLGETRYQRRRAGAAKGGEYGYPHTLIRADLDAERSSQHDEA